MPAQEMTTPFAIGYVEGLHEALRLMGLEDSIDFGTGAIMTRLKQLQADPDQPTDTDRLIHIAKVQQIETDTFSLRIGMSQELQKDAVGVLRKQIDASIERTK